MRCLLVAAVAVTACGPRATTLPHAPAMWPTLDEAFLTAYAETGRFTLGQPVLLAISPDGTILFRRTEARAKVADLYVFDPRTGTERVLASADSLLAGKGEALSDAEKARRERTRTATHGVVDADASRDGKRVLVPIGERVFIVDLAGGAAREVSVGPGYPYDPRLSPDGSTVSFVRDGEVWLADAGGGTPRQLTHGAGGAIEHGVAEFVAQEELDRTRGYWWAPDGKTVLFQETDASKVDTLYVSDPRHPDQAPVPFRYPQPGRANADVKLGLIPAAGGDPRWIDWDRARWPYVADVVWDEDGPLTLVVLDRNQDDIAVLRVEPATGKTTVLLSEHDDAWINVPAGAPHWLANGAGFLWMTEQPGSWVVELRGPDGTLVRRLTEPALGVRSIGGVDEKNQLVWVTAGTTSIEDQVWQVPLAGGAPKQITSGGGVHTVVAKHGVAVITSFERDGTTSWKVTTATGDSALRSVAEEPPYMPTTELETVDAGGLSFAASITRPRAFESSRRYPVLVKVYGGPGVRNVLDTRRAYLIDQFYADAGFVVVRIDNRGTPGRGRTWERAILRDLGTVPVTDQVAALRVLGARHHELDMDRVGVLGWSFGGYMSLMLLLQHPELYKAAVSGAPVTDWALYDTTYTERYMKLPQDNADGYDRASVLSYAGKLARPLLVIDGITDDNVHFANTLALIEAFYLAGKRAEIVTLSSTHMVPDPKLMLAQEKIQIDFFRLHLAP